MKISDKKARGQRRFKHKTPEIEIHFVDEKTRTYSIDVIRQQLLACKHYLADIDVPLYKLTPIV